MAELLVAAHDLPSGYIRGDIITVQDDNHVWGGGESAPDFTVVKVPGTPKQTFVEAMKPLRRVAGKRDPEFGAPDFEDRFVKLHRRRVRIDLDGLSTSRNMSFAELRPHLRKLRYVRGRVEVTDKLAI